MIIMGKGSEFQLIQEQREKENRTHFSPLLKYLWTVRFQGNYSAQFKQSKLSVLNVLEKVLA